MSGPERCYHCEGLIDDEQVAMHKGCADHLRSLQPHPPKRCAALKLDSRCDRDEGHEGPHVNWADNKTAGCWYWAW